MADQLTLTVDWGDGSPVEYHTDVGISPFAIPHTYLNNGDYTVHTAWFDNHGEGNSKDLSLTVDNVAPTLSDLAVTSPIQVGDFATLSASIADPGPVDSHTLIVDWGDGSSVDVYTYDPVTTSFAEKHQYNQAGTFIIQLSLFDDASSTSANVSIDVGTLSPGAPVRLPAGGQPTSAPASQAAAPAQTVADRSRTETIIPARQDAGGTAVTAVVPRSGSRVMGWTRGPPLWIGAASSRTR